MIETRQLRSLAAAGLFLAFFIGFGRGVRRGHAGKIMAADAESESAPRVRPVKPQKPAARALAGAGSPAGPGSQTAWAGFLRVT